MIHTVDGCEILRQLIGGKHPMIYTNGLNGPRGPVGGSDVDRPLRFINDSSRSLLLEKSHGHSDYNVIIVILIATIVIYRQPR